MNFFFESEYVGHVSPQIDVRPELPEKLKPEKSDEPPPLPAKKKIGQQHEERVPLPVFEPSERPRFTRQISTVSQRGNRIIRPPQARHVASGNRRQIGKGLVGRWLNRTIKRKRLTSAVKQQIESMEDHRYVRLGFFAFVIVLCNAFTNLLSCCFISHLQTLFHILGFIRSSNNPYYNPRCLRFCSCWVYCIGESGQGKL